MAQHRTKNGMIREALQEMIEVAEYCILFEKSNSENWKGYNGCYGYPSAILLLSIVDSVGTLIEGGGDDTKVHFKILNNMVYKIYFLIDYLHMKKTLKTNITIKDIHAE